MKKPVDTQQFEAKKDVGFEILGVVMMIVLAAVIGALFMWGAAEETEEKDGRSEHSTNKR